MRLPALPASPGRRRALAFVLALLFEILFLLAFFTPFSPFVRKTTPALDTITLQPPAQESASTRAPSKAKATTTDTARPPPTLPPPPVPQVKAPPAFVELTREDFAAGDIAKVPSQTKAGGGEGDRGTASAGSSYGPGEGPNGAPLYNAEWYVEPTPGQLALYLPSGGPRPGWALIMCRTAPDYRVEDCRGLSESPPGSRLMSALRQAAWQFKVRPPRRGGQPIIGAWVRIRFDWIER